MGSFLKEVKNKKIKIEIQGYDDKPFTIELLQEELRDPTSWQRKVERHRLTKTKLIRMVKSRIKKMNTGKNIDEISGILFIEPGWEKSLEELQAIHEEPDEVIRKWILDG